VTVPCHVGSDAGVVADAVSCKPISMMCKCHNSQVLWLPFQQQCHCLSASSQLCCIGADIYSPNDAVDIRGN